MSEVRKGGRGPFELGGRRAVVTGGSSGIGAATARRLAEAGASVAVGYNSGAERAAAVAAALPGGGHRTLRLPMEETTAIRAAADELRAAWGRCDVLVNCAGWTRPVPHADLEALDDATIDRVFAVNFRGPFATIRAFLPLLRAAGDAVVVNISSLSAVTGQGSSVAYAASKAALDTMGMSLARVLGPGIRVLGVSPAAVNTGFVPGRGYEGVVRQAAGTPLKTATEPDDVALAVLAAVTHLRLSTGTTILVDGGHHL